MTKYFTELDERNIYAPATEQQIREAKMLAFKYALKDDVLSCPHTVFYDVESFMYTQRTCLACNCVFELI